MVPVLNRPAGVSEFDPAWVDRDLEGNYSGLKLSYIFHNLSAVAR